MLVSDGVLHVNPAQVEEQTWKKVAETLRRELSMRVGDGERARDLVQEVFVRALDGIDDLRDETRLLPWMRRIARNLVIDEARKAKGPRGRVDELTREPADHGEREEDWTPVMSALAQWLKMQLPTLPPAQAEAIELVELEGLSQIEAARRVGISHSGMKSRVQRGRARLSEALKDCCALEIDERGRVVECVPRDEPCGGCSPN
jgi:RNA polymerase sigma-70 factor (ECF subfamily)